ncbi:SCO6880 family protein [Streptomyces sp. NPDC057681]|uniref:SCO6880 family protein n=1 Tax=Streptomyces sp. NPDC057681 TaxID=3346209 RepID=UPI00367C7D1D
MAAPEAHPAKRPTYGNWRRPQSSGLGSLGLGVTMILFSGLILVVLATLVSLGLALVLVLLLALVLVPMIVKDRHGRTVLTRIGGNLAWRQSVSAGSNLYRSGPLGRTGHGTCTLPGLAAGSELTEAQDAYGRPFALLTYPSTGHHVAVLTCEADGAGLVDNEQVDQWVAHWGQWLAGLGSEPGIVGASVTVETAPDTGIRLAQEVRSNLAEDAPDLAKAMYADVLKDYPAGSARISTRIALTYSGAARAGHPRRDAGDMAVLIGNRLPGLSSTLAMTGAGPARPMTAVELAEAVRVAYDPTVAPLIEEASHNGGSGLTWADAGPVGADESKTAYSHDGSYSVTWCMADAPRGAVQSSVFTGLVSPSDDIARKRVTILYRPHDPASATRVVQSDKAHAQFRAAQQKREKARDTAALRAATQTEEEEASGAGVVRFSLLVTATVTSREDLPRAEAAMDNLSGPARIALRKVTSAQASAFAAALPIGLVLPHHLTVPSTVRDYL